jgi:hypothetical protein
MARGYDITAQARLPSGSNLIPASVGTILW